MGYDLESTLIPYSASPVPPARCVLVLAPHPDDEVFGCGGALIGHVKAGCPVWVIVVSDGAYSAEGPQKQHVIATREAESCAAAALLGYAAPTFWRLPDRGVEYAEQLVSRVLQAIIFHKADLVYAPALTEMHPDHRSVAMAAVEAVRRIGAGVRLAMYEVGVPLSPNVLLDITAVAALKLQAMRCFGSQLAAQAYDDHIVALNRFRTYTLPAQVRMAEAFRLHEGTELSPSALPLFDSEYVRQAKLGLPVWSARDVPLISVVVRSRCDEWLKVALDSLSLQTYPNIEVIVASAGREVTPTLVSRCGRFPMRLACENGATFSHSGTESEPYKTNAQKYLAFLEDDCVLDPDHFSRLVEVVKSHAPKCVIAYGGVRTFVGRGDSGVEAQAPIHAAIESDQQFHGEGLRVSSLLIPQTLITQGGSVDKALEFCENLNFWERLANLAPLAYSGRIIVTSHRLPKQYRSVPKGQEFNENWSCRVDKYKHVDPTPLALKVRQLEISLANAHDDIRAFRASSSWRVTGPLRFFVTQLLRIKQTTLPRKK